MVAENLAVGQDITDQTSTEEALKGAKYRLELAQRYSRAGTWDWDLSSGKIDWSPEMFELLGLDAKSYVASFETWNQVLYPEDREIAYSRIDDALKKHTGLDSDCRIVKPDGEVRWINALGKGVYDEQGRPVRMTGLCIDITERKRNDEKIKRQNIILNSISRIYESAIRCNTLEALGEACLEVAEFATESKFSFIGEIGADGLMHEIAISDMGWELCKMPDKTGHRRPPGSFRIQGFFGKIAQSGKPLIANDPESHPLSIGVPEGHPKLTAFLGAPLIREGMIAGVIGLANRQGGYHEEQAEILEKIAPTMPETILRKRTELALEESEEKFRLVADFTFDWETWIGSEGSYIYVSPSCERVTGYTAEDFMNNPRLAVDILHPDDRALFEGHRDAHWNEHAEIEGIDYRIYNRNGELRWISHHCQPVFGRNGEWLGRRGSNRDITYSKRQKMPFSMPWRARNTADRSLRPSSRRRMML